VTHSAHHHTNLDLHTLGSLKHNDKHKLQSSSQNGHHNTKMSHFSTNTLRENRN